MKFNIPVCVVALAFACELAWAQPERRLLIEPSLPHANEPITISVTNSHCYDSPQVIASPGWISIRLVIRGIPCSEDHPNYSGFKTTIGPLTEGDYRLSLHISPGGFGANVADSTTFTVMAPLPFGVPISDGGINGLYHDPEAPHRYLYVLETDNTTLVVWNTFDADGDQLWVYGVGDIFNDGRSIEADAYINTSGGFSPDGIADDDVKPWGLIRVDLISCTEGIVTYEKGFPAHLRQQFPIQRLAYSKQIGCQD